MLNIEEVAKNGMGRDAGGGRMVAVNGCCLFVVDMMALMISVVFKSRMIRL